MTNICSFIIFLFHLFERKKMLYLYLRIINRDYCDVSIRMYIKIFLYGKGCRYYIKTNLSNLSIYIKIEKSKSKTRNQKVILNAMFVIKISINP